MDNSLLTHPGFIGGLIGAAVGLLGGLVGTYFSLRSAKNRREKMAIVLFVVAILGATVAFLYFLLTADKGARVYYWLGFAVLYPPLLFLGIKLLNRLHAEK